MSGHRGTADKSHWDRGSRLGVWAKGKGLSTKASPGPAGGWRLTEAAEVLLSVSQCGKPLAGLMK